MSKNPPRKRKARASDSQQVPAPRAAQRPEAQSASDAGERNNPSPKSVPREEESRGQSHDILVVGIGASAGGLEALEQFFSHVPADSGLAYVVVQHLAPQHVSMLAQLLGRRTEMPVVEAKDGVRTEADHVYVIAPGTLLGIAGGRFQVTFVDAERHLQIDVFLRSLAEDQGERAIGVVLSGSGGDGTDGLRAIKEHGGLTLAQTPETAKYDIMPRNAIDAGVVDQVLPPEAMPAKLLERVRQVAEGHVQVVTPLANAASPGAPSISNEQLEASLDQICPILQQRTGHDFSHYKRGTVLRRLRRRLQLRQPSSLNEYLDFLEKDTQETELLAKDLLIGVTQFFRDPEAFEHLGLHVLPHIIAASRAGEGVRIWVPGCASGEEAYSLGILLRERLAELIPAPSAQIFATDIDAEAIAEARQARYPADIAQHVSPARLARFFTPDGSSYQVAREVREMCIFSEHSLIRDPPFLGLDLISCRNLLIYLDATLQKKLVPVFHYALKPGGYLFLGPSESWAEHSELFETVDKRFRVFRRAEPLTRPLVEFPLASRAHPRPAPPASAAPLTQEQAINAAFERLMLQEYVPPSAVVNMRGDVICVAGLTGGYLQPPAGVLTTNILDIAHASLRIELRTALHTAARSGKKVVREDVQVEVNGLMRRLRLAVRPLSGVKLDGLFAVILQERTGEVEAEPAVIGAEGESAIEQLEGELRTTRANLRATIEELESANEELKSSNEEMLSTNEELQSTNEELRSSQEELKSVNEELVTVNAELGRNVDELGRMNSDLQNLFSSTDVATLFLDREQRVTRFTPAAKALFRLIEADAGRPLADLAPRFVDQDLAADVREVLRTLRSVERDVETVDRQAWYLLRILPYRTVENVIAGAVITLADITAQKQLEHQLRDSQAYNRGLIEASVDGLITVDTSGAISDVNARLCQMTGYTREALIGTPFADYFVDAEQAEAGVKETFEKGIVTDYALTLATQDKQHLRVSFNASVFRDPAGQVRGIFASARDITAQARLQAQLEEERAYNRGLIEASVDGLVTVDEALTITDANDTMCRLVGRSRHQLIGSSFPSYFTEPERAAEGVLLTFKEGAVTNYVLTLQGENGYPLPVAFNAAVFKDTTGQVRGIFASARDIQESAARLRAIINAVPDLLLVVDEDGRCVEALSTQHPLYTESTTFQGKLLSEVLPAELAQQALHAIRQTLLTRQPQTVEYALHLAPTSQRYFEARATPLELPRATKPAAVVLVRDITEQRLTEESLRQAQKMEAVGQLTGGMAHDFNNLLGIILGNLDLLAEAVDRPELQDLVRRSMEAAERGTTLVQRLLAFARRQPLQAQPVDLNRLITGMTELLRRTLGETIQVETVLAEDLAQVVVDPGQFETALLNLALNARDAMPTGGRLTVETANLWLDEDYAAVHQPVQPGPYVLLAVSDTGSGMSAEAVEHVFEPFFTTKEAGKGSGLGLSMVYGLVKQSQGHIQLYSEVGRGTVIKIYLPPQAGATGSDLAVRRPEAPLPAGQGQTILVVEDEPSMRQLAVSMLHSLGYQTVAADTAASALQVLEATPQVMVLFTDIILPGGMNGIDLARTAHQRRPDLKVLFTSGYTASHLASLSRHPPGMEWLSKPYRKSQLAIKLHILLDPRA